MRIIVTTLLALGISVSFGRASGPDSMTAPSAATVESGFEALVAAEYADLATQLELRAGEGVPPTFADCRANCRECFLRPWYTEAYLNQFGAEGGWRSDVVYACADASCPQPSNDCGGGGSGGPRPESTRPIGTDEVTLLWSAAVEGDAHILKSYVAERTLVTLNHERGTVQVLDCSGGVVANIPLTQSVLRALAE